MNNIKKYRTMKNMTQEQLGKIIGTTRQYINALETGECPLPFVHAKKLSAFFNVSTHEIYGEEIFKNTENLYTTLIELVKKYKKESISKSKIEKNISIYDLENIFLNLLDSLLLNTKQPNIFNISFITDIVNAAIYKKNTLKILIDLNMIVQFYI